MRLQTDDAYKLKNSLSVLQGSPYDFCYRSRLGVLFNKGRYFEMSIYKKDLLVSISKAIKVKIQFGNMLVGPKEKLEFLVRAFNKRGIYLNITLDWI